MNDGHVSNGPHGTGLRAAPRAFLHAARNGDRKADSRLLLAFAVLACLRPRRHALVLAFSLAAACLTLSLGATPASAVIAHPFLSSFNGEATPGGRMEVGELAVDYSASQSSGDIYVASGGAVDKFSAAPGSAYLCQITGAGSATSSPSECDGFGSGAPEGSFNGAAGVAVDPASGDVYISDSSHNVVDKFDATGTYLAQITGLSRPTSLAVDASTGDLYIVNAEADEVKKYDPTSASLTTFATGTPVGSFGAAYKVAVDNSAGASAGDVYVADVAGSGVVDKFNSSGTFLSQLSGPASASFSGLFGLAVDPANGDLYVVDRGAGVVDQFDATGGLLGQIAHASMEPVSVAFAANNDVYVSDANESKVDVFGPGVAVPGVHTGGASNVTATGATLGGSVNPAALAVSDCHFDYVDEADYNPSLANPYRAGQTAPCAPGAASLPSDSEDHAVSAGITGLTPGMTYRFRLEASNANGTGEGTGATFTTLPTPVVDSATASELTASSVMLTAKINPRGSDTHYHFEYGTNTTYGESIPVPAEDIGSGEEDVTRSQTVGGLLPDHTYHWRVVAVNANGTTFGADHTFIHDTNTGQGLPDNRAYELVSPPHRNGAALGFEGGSLETEVAPGGSRVLTESLQCFGASQSCNAQNSNALGTPYELDRTRSGWVTTSLMPPAGRFSRAIPWGVSVESGMLLFGAPAEPLGEEDLYVRQPGGTFVHLGPVTRPEAGPYKPAGGAAGGEAQAFTADLSHVAWETASENGRATLWPFDQTQTGANSVYEYAGNKEPLLVGVTGGPDSHDLVSVCKTSLGGSDTGRPGVMSTDGRIVFFTAHGGVGCVGSGANSGTPVTADELYARVDGERPDAHTVAISARSASDCTGECLSSPAGAASFVGASADGSKAFFLSTQRLSDQASQDKNRTDVSSVTSCAYTKGENGCNLYEYDFGNPAGRELVTVSAGDSSGEGPRVQGVLAISDDGSHVYFVARGVLASNLNGAGQSARDGAHNLYVFERDAASPAGRVTFIASLSQTDLEVWSGGAPDHQASVTPDGRYLVFVSHGDLTVDDSSVSGAYQVFRYDAQTGDLIRISIGNNGFNDNGNRSAPTPCEPFRCSEDAGLASSPARRDATMSDDGSYVFFQSPVALTPHALDDVQVFSGAIPGYAQNIYEWHEGHVYLISDGQDTTKGGRERTCSQESRSAVCLLGTDATGSNVFFTTADRLVSSDVNTEVDYYDARVCDPQHGSPCIEPSPASLPPCLGEVCHGTPAGVPGVPSAPTVTFDGQGNVFAAPAPVVVAPKSLTRAQRLARALRACLKKRNGRLRAACERSARKRYGPTGRAKRSSVVSRARADGRSK